MNTLEFFRTIISFNTKRKGFIGLTGAFPYNSIRGNLYGMDMYDYDDNAILFEPIKIGTQKPYTVLFSKFTSY